MIDIDEGKAIKPPKCPCTQNCQLRDADCHGNCAEYLAYERERNRYYQKRYIVSRGKAMLQSQENAWTEFLRRKQKGKVTYGV